MQHLKLKNVSKISDNKFTKQIWYNRANVCTHSKVDSFKTTYLFNPIMIVMGHFLYGVIDTMSV